MGSVWKKVLKTTQKSFDEEDQDQDNSSDKGKDQDHINSSYESGNDQHEKIQDKNKLQVETDFNVNHDDENIENIEEDIDVDENEEEPLPEESIIVDENINNNKEDINVDENGAEQVPVDPESIMIDESGRKWTRILYNVSSQEAEEYFKDKLEM